MIELDLTAAVVALLAFAGLLLQEWRHDRGRRQDRTAARADALRDAQLANKERWIAEIENYLRLVNLLIADLRMTANLPKAERGGYDQERTGSIYYAYSVSQAAARLLDPSERMGLENQLAFLWVGLRGVYRSHSENDGPVPAEDLKNVENPAKVATFHIMGIIGTLREESAEP